MAGLRDAYEGKVVPLRLHGLRLELGVVDTSRPGVAEAISRLLFRSIGDARATLGGHLPDWLVTDVERNYISPEKVRTLWAPHGHRFAVMKDGEIVGTAHLTRSHDTIFTVDRYTNNVPSARFPGFKPERHHHLVNLSVLHELRRARIGRGMIDSIAQDFRDLFDGDGIWVRGDPPWHVGLVGLGFEHDPSRDLFLPETAERTAGISHAELNARYACDCRPEAPFDPEALARRPERLAREKLQYVSFTRAFDAPKARSARPRTNGAADVATEVVVAATSGLAARTAVVITPSSSRAVATVLAEASARGVPVVVRGREQSATRLSRAERGLVLATEGLDAPITHDGHTVTVSGGTTWRALVRALLAEGLLPRVVPGWLDASIGGTIATGGLGKGSVDGGLLLDVVEEIVVATGDGRLVTANRRQAAWLFEAALGGLGQVGVIVSAKLALRSAPKDVAVHLAEATDLEPALRAAAEGPGTWHVTAFAHDGTTWGVVQVIDAGAASVPAIEGARCLALTKALTYLEATRPAPPPDTRHLHVALPPLALGPWLDDAMPRLGPEASVQVVPIRRSATQHASLVALPDAPEGALVYAVLTTRPPREDDALRDAALLEATRALGGRDLLGGTLPRDEATWDLHLGERRASFTTAYALADPAAILGTLSGLTRT